MKRWRSLLDVILAAAILVSFVYAFSNASRSVRSDREVLRQTREILSELRLYIAGTTSRAEDFLRLLEADHDAQLRALARLLGRPTGLVIERRTQRVEVRQPPQQAPARPPPQRSPTPQPSPTCAKTHGKCK
jgi:hypothetical protein